MTTRSTFLQTTALGIAGSAFAQTPSPAAPIDFHAHWIGPRVVELLGKRTSPRPPQGQGWFDIDARLRQMDDAGVRRQVLSYVGASYDGVMAPDEARPFWRAQNDDVAALIKKHPPRFSGLATLPTANVAWAADELQRAHQELGLIGATLPLDAVPDRILFGTDSGPTSLVAQTIAAIRQAALTAEEKQQVLVDNGRRLLEARGIK